VLPETILLNEQLKLHRITYWQEEMKISTFEEDLLGLDGFAEKLEKFINVEHRYVPESLVISLNGSFGSGKSTFFKMWTDRLAKKKSLDDKLFVVEVNVWNDDYCGDPLVSLVSALIESLSQKNQDTQGVLDAAIDVGWFLTGIGNQVVKTLTGINPVAAGELAEKKKSARKRRQDFSGNYFDIYKAKKKALASLKNAIRAIISGDNPNILILVDELDRCRPDYAISYLETIKHVFDIKGIVFVIAVDRKQLECSAKAAFGADLDFPEYYRKFIQREVTLPKPETKTYKGLVTKYVEYYLQRENERHCFMSLDSYRIDNIVTLISCMKMTPRQVQEVFRIMGHVLETNEPNKGKLLWCIGEGTILMSALRLGNPDVYEKLGRQELGIHEAATFFKELGVRDPEWWFTLCLTGKGLNNEQIKNKEVVDIYREVGFVSGDAEHQKNPDLGQWYSGWGHSSDSRFKQIYSRIEQISSWN